MFRLGLSLFTILLLAGCAGKPQVTDSDKQNWLEMANNIKLIKTWSIEGKVGARNGDDATSFNIVWSQQGDEFSIRLFGPMGQGAISIYGDTDYAIMKQGETSQQAGNLHELMSQNSNLNLPLDHLTFWIRGIPSPETRAGIKVDHEGLLSEIKQDNWKVEYSEYYYDETPMPRKLNVSKADMSAKIIIKEWSIE